MWLWLNLFSYYGCTLEGRRGRAGNDRPLYAQQVTMALPAFVPAAPVLGLSVYYKHMSVHSFSKIDQLSSKPLIDVIALGHCSCLIYTSISCALIKICESSWVGVRSSSLSQITYQLSYRIFWETYSRLQFLLRECKIITDLNITKGVLVQIHPGFCLSSGTRSVYTSLTHPAATAWEYSSGRGESGCNQVHWGLDLCLLLSPVLLLALSLIYPRP